MCQKKGNQEHFNFILTYPPFLLEKNGIHSIEPIILSLHTPNKPFLFTTPINFIQIKGESKKKRQ